MGYQLEAFIGRRETLAPAERTFWSAKIVPLEEGWALLPFTDRLFDEVEHAGPEEGGEGLPEFGRLSPALERWARAISRRGPLVYAESSFFGGMGSQSAVVWSRGRVLFGPEKGWRQWDERRQALVPEYSDMPLNRALLKAGVRARGSHDAFDTLGLFRYRYAAEWLAAKRAPIKAA